MYNTKRIGNKVYCEYCGEIAKEQQHYREESTYYCDCEMTQLEAKTNEILNNAKRKCEKQILQRVKYLSELETLNKKYGVEVVE